MKYFSRLSLVIASLCLPNMLLATISLYADQKKFAALFGGLSLLGGLLTFAVQHQLRTSLAGEHYRVVTIRRFNYDMFSHIVSYLPSLIAFGLGAQTDVFALFAFYVFYILVVSMSDVVVLNPILHLFGWRFRGANIQYDHGTEEVMIVSPPNKALVLGNPVLVKLSNFGMYLLDE